MCRYSGVAKVDRLKFRIPIGTGDIAPEAIAKDRDIASHIFTTSSVMLGLCLTIVSIMRGQQNAAMFETIVDDIIAVDALIFLTSCFLSYTALRIRHKRRIHQIEAFADWLFLLGLTGMGIACSLFVWSIF